MFCIDGNLEIWWISEFFHWFIRWLYIFKWWHIFFSILNIINLLPISFMLDICVKFIAKHWGIGNHLKNGSHLGFSGANNFFLNIQPLRDVHWNFGACIIIWTILSKSAVIRPTKVIFTSAAEVVTSSANWKESAVQLSGSFLTKILEKRA